MEEAFSIFIGDAAIDYIFLAMSRRVNGDTGGASLAARVGTALRGKERIEDLPQRLGRHTAAAVAHHKINHLMFSFPTREKEAEDVDYILEKMNWGRPDRDTNQEKGLKKGTVHSP